jgi:hypothetical protein
MINVRPMHHQIWVYEYRMTSAESLPWINVSPVAFNDTEGIMHRYFSLTCTRVIAFYLTEYGSIRLVRDGKYFIGVVDTVYEY